MQVVVFFVRKLLRELPGPRFLTFVRASFSFRLFWHHGKEAISEVVSRCILLVFLQVKLLQAHLLPSAISPSLLLIRAVLTPLKHSTSLSAMFVYICVSLNNPINARAPSLGPRISLFSEVSYYENKT